MLASVTAAGGTEKLIAAGFIRAAIEGVRVKDINLVGRTFITGVALQLA